MKKGKFRVVLAYVQTKSDDSPNKEIIQRWAKEEIDVLWTEDVLNEYVNKMKDFSVSEDKMIKVVSQFIQFGEVVEIKFFHYEAYPDDARDVCFVLCVLNGRGTHIVTYDRHLLDLADEYSQNFLSLF